MFHDVFGVMDAPRTSFMMTRGIVIGNYCLWLKGFEHALDNYRTANLAVGCLGDNKAVGALNHIVCYYQVTTNGQTVHELTIVCP
jgi:hypothetical protein